MHFQERYAPLLLGVNEVRTMNGASAVGFFATKTAGTLTLARRDGTLVLDAFPVSAGAVYGLPLRMGHDFIITLAGGASGTMGVAN